uniref:Uncharacterized protein n=1 Tax=Cacopsylla melanoneura TaxID=428564 RepID=A0A8D8QV98_9HEMI
MKQHIVHFRMYSIVQSLDTMGQQSSDFDMIIIMDSSIPNEQSPDAILQTSEVLNLTYNTSPGEQSVPVVDDSFPVHQEVIGNEHEDEHRSRRRYRDETTWKANVRKRSKLLGLEHISSTGKVNEEKFVKPVDCSKCTRKCSEYFTDEIRLAIFSSYWNLKDIDRQRLYLSGLIEENNKKSCRIYNQDKESRREKTLSYYLQHNERIQVCKKMFF